MHSSARGGVMMHSAVPTNSGGEHTHSDGGAQADRERPCDAKRRHGQVRDMVLVDAPKDSIQLTSS